MGDTPRPNFPANKSATNQNGNVTRDPVGEGIEAGSKHVVNALDCIAAQYGDQTAMGYAGGMLGGLRQHFVAHHGARETYELFQRFADDLASEIVRPAGVQ